MRLSRFYHSARLMMISSKRKRAEYLKKHHLFGMIGMRCYWGPSRLPVYPQLIRLHDNVYIHKSALLVPHDMINRFLKQARPEYDFGWRERLGCIEIMDHVYVGMNAVILPDVRIGRNCIISAGSVVTNDVPEGSIVAGNPARVVGRFDAYVASRLMARDQQRPFPNQALPDALAKACWQAFDARHTEGKAPDAPSGAEPADEEIRALTERINALLAGHMNGIPFAREEALIDRGALDSLGLMTVISLLEDAFSCQIPFQYVTADHFNSTARMAALIAALQRGGERRDDPAGPKAQAAQAFEPLPLTPDAAQTPVVGRILAHAAAQPSVTAIIANDHETSYRELAGMILSIRDWLMEQGVARGGRVAVQAVHTETCVACYYAVHLLGAVLVPVEKSAAPARILEIARETKAALIISVSAQASDIPWKEYGHVQAISRRVSFDPAAPIALPELDWPCEMIFTTGTTGKSKGVLMTHRHMAWYAYAVAKRVEMKKGNRFLLTTPLNHAGGLRRTHLMLANGCCMVYLDGLNDLNKFFMYIQKYRVTSLYLPPVAIRILMTRTGDELSKYRDQIDFVYSSSSPLPAGDCESLKALLPRTRLYNAYEASETPGVSAYDYNEEPMLAGCLGPANDGVELAVLKEDGAITTQPGVQGQICVKSAMNMLAYDGEEALTQSVFRDGWFVSNDLGTLDEKGQLYMQGRKGDVINLGGYKIAPTDVEEAALMSGLIQECICVEDYDEFRVPFIKLIVVAGDAQAFDAKRLTAFLTDRLEAYKVPRKIETADRIQKTFNGKIDRKAYRKVQ